MSDNSHKTFRVGCVQLRAGRDPVRNIDTASALVCEAAGHGCDLIITPEQTSLMELKTEALFAHAVEEDQDEALATFRALAVRLERWLLIGSLAIRVAPDKAANRSFLINPEGFVVARYDKIHMFDVDLSSGERYRESKNYKAGNQAVLAQMPWGAIGLTVCYDLRFPALYRTLAQAGADFLTAPAAFTKTSGEAHWHVLLRARAIENGCFVFAAAQGGRHENGRDTYGHSIIISPWGKVLAEAGIEPGVIHADIDPAMVGAARARIPALDHDRAFSMFDPAKSARAS